MVSCSQLGNELREIKQEYTFTDEELNQIGAILL